MNEPFGEAPTRFDPKSSAMTGSLTHFVCGNGRNSVKARKELTRSTEQVFAFSLNLEILNMYIPKEIALNDDGGGGKM